MVRCRTKCAQTGLESVTAGFDSERLPAGQQVDLVVALGHGVRVAILRPPCCPLVISRRVLQHEVLRAKEPRNTTAQSMGSSVSPIPSVGNSDGAPTPLGNGPHGFQVQPYGPSAAVASFPM